MTVKNLFVKSMAGFFPEANSPEKLWDNLLQAKVAPPVSLEEYWKLSKSEYGNENNDGQIAIDLGHLASFPFENKNFPRQIGAAIEVGRKLLEKQGNKRTYGLVVATEWTDPSYYEAELGIIPKEDGYSADKQIETIKSELNLSGPALAVDTACASSLYALEIARGMLSSYTLDGVIVIGLNLYLHPFLYRGFTKLGALSKKGALTSFDAEADGIIPGEAACGVLLSDESEDALAEINGIGLSSDGNEGSAFSPGLMGQMASYERLLS
jgi:acyl transferase domain-containing protein